MIEQLGMDDIICTRLNATNGVLSGKPEGEFCYGMEKAVRLREYCEKNNSKSKEAWYYGDASADIFVLDTVGHPVCVNPEKKLARIAFKRDWKIVHWKN
jgi:putative phosphoserine phosphatase/1-acylglycerol-3-phosphate O-acyltransferase